jgi:uncharacterized protein DUF4386
MTTAVHGAATERTAIDPTRRTAFVAGALYLLTFLSSIPALGLKGPVLDDPDFVLGSGPANGVLLGGLLDVVNALACIGTAVVLFSVTRRHDEAAALGFVAARVLEAAVIVVGVISLYSVVTLRQDLAGATGADEAALATAGRTLVAVHDWTFLFGPGLMAGVNALLLGSVLYRSGLVPRVIPLLGLIGAPLLLASSTATMFGLWDQVSAVALIATLPVAAWELSLGVWLVVKGFTPSPVASDASSGVTASPRG